MTKQNLPNESSTNNNLVSEKNYYLYLYDLKPRSAIGNVSFTSTTSGETYSTETYLEGYFLNQGQEGLLLILQDVLKDYLFTAEDLNDFTTNFNNLSDSVATSIEDIDAKINQLYKTNAEQNLQLWELEADVIQDKEAMSGWQGDGLFEYQNEVDTSSHVTPVRGSTIGSGGVYFGDPEPSTNFKDITAITGITVAPSVSSYCDISSDNKYFAIGGGTTFRIYKRNGETYDLLNGIVLVNTVTCVAFSPNGAYLAITLNTTPYVKFYKLNAEGTSYSELADVGTLPTGYGYSVGFDSTGMYCAVGHNVSPFVTIYKRADDTFNKLANPTILPSEQGSSISFATTSEGYTYLAVGFPGSFKGINVYRRSVDDTFVYQETSNLTSTYSSTSDVSFSPDATYLTVGLGVSPWCIVLKRTDTTFTQIVALNSGDAVGCVKFSPDGNYLLCSNYTANQYARVYKKVGDSFSEVWGSYALGFSTPASACFSSDNQYLHLVSAGACKSIAFKDSTTIPTSGNFTLKPITLPEVSNSVFLLEDSTLDAGVVVQYEVSLDGGTTWEVITTFGEVVVLGHTGTELVIKASYTRDVSGVGTGYIEWLVVWGGVS